MELVSARPALLPIVTVRTTVLEPSRFQPLRRYVVSMSLIVFALLIGSPAVFAQTSALTSLHSFTGTDGEHPHALIQGSDGNLYGTTTSGGSSGLGTAFKFEVLPGPPPPTIDSISYSAPSVVLHWTASAGATSYNAYEGTSPGAEAATPVQAGITGTTATLNVTPNAPAYFFTVAAVNSAGVGGGSNEVNVTAAAPPPPTGLAAVSGSDGHASLSWNAVSGATDYIVYWGTAPSVYTNASYDSATNFTFSGLLNGITYYFAVAAENAVGTSADSNEVSVVGTGNFPPAPGPLRITATGSSEVTLRWGASKGALAYAVYSGYPNYDQNLVKMVIKTSATVAAAPGEALFVVALNLAGQSAPSNVVTVTFP